MTLLSPGLPRLPARPPRNRRRALALAGTAVAALLTLSACGSDAGEAAPASEPSATAEGPACTYTAGGSAAAEVDLPPDTAGYVGEVPAVIETSAGAVDVVLDADAAPCTVSSFASLATQGYYDDTPCHRLTTEGIYVLQCGDPTGTGGGGPGYSYDDELSGDEEYPAGTLAMANAGADTNGSQFFMVYQDTPLPPAYTVFGTIGDEGLAAVEAVGADGAKGGAPDGPPATPVDITSVTIG